MACMFSAVRGALGEPDILVNNAGIAAQKLFTDVTADEWDEMMAVHVRGAFLCCRAALPHMIRQKWGRIINIASMWGQVGASCEVPYSAAKAALYWPYESACQRGGPQRRDGELHCARRGRHRHDGWLFCAGQGGPVRGDAAVPALAPRRISLRLRHFLPLNRQALSPGRCWV